MSRLRPIHLVVVAAFGAGVLITLLFVVAFGSDDKSATLSASAPVATSSAVVATPRPLATSTPVAVPTLVVVPLQPSIPGLIAPTPLAALPSSALLRPGACTMSSEPDYLSKSVPPLQQLGSLYQGWSNAPITTSSAQMHSLQQILGSFTQSFEAISPLPEGCAFVHNGVVQAAKDLIDTAGRVDFNNTALLHPGWEAEYKGRASNMKNAIDLYVSSTGITLAPRPFADGGDRALP